MSETNLAEKIREFKSLIKEIYPNYKDHFWHFGAAICSDLSKGKTVEEVHETLKEWIE